MICHDPKINLERILEGFVRSYHTLNLNVMDKRQKYYIREIDYFARLGESLGYFTFFDDSGREPGFRRELPMNLAWYEREPGTGSMKACLHVETGKLFLNPFDELARKIFSPVGSGLTPSHLVAIIHSEQEVSARSFVEILNNKYAADKNSLIICKIFSYEKRIFHKMLCWQLPFKDTTVPRTVITDIGLNGSVSLFFRDETGHYDWLEKSSLNIKLA